MKALLLFKDSEYGKSGEYSFKNDIIKDLNLNVLFRAASREVCKDGSNVKKAEPEDLYIYDTMKLLMLKPLDSSDGILYRQHVLNDFINNPEIIKKIYNIAVNMVTFIEKNKQSIKEQRNRETNRGGLLLGKIELLKQLNRHLDELNANFENDEFKFSSEALVSFCNRLKKDNTPEFSQGIKEILKDIAFFTEGGGIVYCCSPGEGMKPCKINVTMLKNLGYREKTKRRQIDSEKWFQKLFKPTSITLSEPETIKHAKEMETEVVAGIISAFDNYISEQTEFFTQLKYQTAFYMGAVNLYQRCRGFALHFTMPEIIKGSGCSFEYEDLYELGMATLTQKPPVANSFSGIDKHLLIITGANQGGKSTCLRSIGIAHVLMQCGMYVPARKFVSSLYTDIFTHFTRREDSTMNSGRLEEELHRMDEIIGKLSKSSLVLLNESFATTTEKEGSIIASDMTAALYEAKVRVCMVTHLLGFAGELYNKQPEHAMFLSAERRKDGQRTYKMVQAEPSQTSYGLDLYEEIIG